MTNAEKERNERLYTQVFNTENLAYVKGVEILKKKPTDAKAIKQVLQACFDALVFSCILDKIGYVDIPIYTDTTTNTLLPTHYYDGLENAPHVKEQTRLLQEAYQQCIHIPKEYQRKAIIACLSTSLTNVDQYQKTEVSYLKKTHNL